MLTEILASLSLSELWRFIWLVFLLMFLERGAVIEIIGGSSCKLGKGRIAITLYFDRFLFWSLLSKRCFWKRLVLLFTVELRFWLRGSSYRSLFLRFTDGARGSLRLSMCNDYFTLGRLMLCCSYGRDDAYRGSYGLINIALWFYYSRWVVRKTESDGTTFGCSFSWLCHDYLCCQSSYS